MTGLPYWKTVFAHNGIGQLVSEVTIPSDDSVQMKEMIFHGVSKVKFMLEHKR
jgi:hypothetical protein